MTVINMAQGLGVRLPYLGKYVHPQSRFFFLSVVNILKYFCLVNHLLDCRPGAQPVRGTAWSPPLATPCSPPLPSTRPEPSPGRIMPSPSQYSWIRIEPEKAGSVPSQDDCRVCHLCLCFISLSSSLLKTRPIIGRSFLPRWQKPAHCYNQIINL